MQAGDIVYNKRYQRWAKLVSPGGGDDTGSWLVEEYHQYGVTRTAHLESDLGLVKTTIVASEPPPAATFDEARLSALEEFDLAVKKIRDIVADPKWTNTGFKQYVEAGTFFARALDRIARLNTVQQEFESEK